ncbi:MAG: VOC family protein [Rhizobiaceae bacterium]|nr:MAG: VOC family protein [Rhizobiaceae bacterium]
MKELPFAADAPISAGRVGLIARDASALADYYRAVVGLAEIARSTGRIVMGAGDRPLIEIEERPDARPDNPRSAGLFHTAFLLPTRADLARWVRDAIDRKIPIDGASDHFVSEALYLTDPEGNGIEIYADRPRDKWNWKDGHVEMATVRLDIPDLLAELSEKDKIQDGGWKGAPENSIIGHVHLRVGNPADAEEWWHSQLGFDTVANYGKAAVFLSTGGYHHHIGANSWQSAGAGPRDKDRTGLAWVEMNTKAAEGEKTLLDPWGTEVRVVPSR